MSLEKGKVLDGIKEVVTEDNLNKVIDGLEQASDAALIINNSGVIPNDKKDNVDRAVKQVGFAIRLVRTIIGLFKKK